MKSIKSFIMTTWLIITFGLFIGLFTLATFVYDNMLSKFMEKSSSKIVNNTLTTINIGMKKGFSRKELEEIIHESSVSLDKDFFDISLHRNWNVEEQFGEIEDCTKPPEVENVLVSGEKLLIHDGDRVQEIVPVKADISCISCHTNVKPGDVLGVVRVSQDLSALSTQGKKEFVFILLMLVPFPLLMGLGISYVINKKIDQTISKFQERIHKINSVRDLTGLKSESVDTGFKELNRIFAEINILIRKLKDVATDKDILEFEVKLLDKFILTADAVNNWKAYIKELISEINRIIPLKTVFALFDTSKSGNDLEVFWLHKPSDELKNEYEKFLIKQFRKNRTISERGVRQILHNVADPSEECEGEFSYELAESEVKLLTFDKKRIGGIVGIGVQSNMASDPTRYIVIDTVLTSLMNVIGSVKAINRYTKDVEFYATRDPLTNLHNQQMFWDLLRAESTRAHRHNSAFSLVILDFDNFKIINDIYGHAFGDMLLKKYADALSKSKREEDILARYGGDEFALILPEADDKQAYAVAKRIKTDLDLVSASAPDGKNIKATSSFGIASYPNHSNVDKQLFMVASNMLYKAKQEGKNRICTPSGEDIIGVMREIGEKNQLILRALEEKALVPYFHPIMTVKDNKVDNHELLMRIQLDGVIHAAYEFIDDAENMGVMHTLDLMLAEKAFIKIKEENYQGTLFVNISPKSLIIEEYVPQMLELTNKYGIDPTKIVLEITERETVRNLASISKFIKDLKTVGFKFAIDDFGSGFSSFHYVKKFPIDVIKIEGEFIQNIIDQNVDRAFVKSIITLAQELDIKTVAEFVESAEVIDILKVLNVDYAQGFYIDKPKPELFDKEYFVKEDTLEDVKS